MERHYYSDVAASTTLVSGISDSAPSMTVSSVAGFPGSFPYFLAIDRGAVTMEIVEVTAALGAVLTINRGISDTVAVAHSASAPVEHVAPASFYDDTEVHTNATSGVHGRAGALVGTTDAQVLTNKTINYPDNTITNIPESAILNLVTDLTALSNNIVNLTATKQPLDGTLTALAGLGGTAGFLVRTGADTFDERSLVAASSKIVITDGNGVATAPTFDISSLDVVSDTTVRKYINKAADETVTASTSFQDDNHFAGISFPANSVWICELVLSITGDQAADFKAEWAVTGGAGIPARHVMSAPIGGGGGTNGNDASVLTEVGLQVRAYDASVSTGIDDSATIQSSYTERIKVSTVATGTVSFRWAQSTATGTTTIQAHKSWFRAERVA